MFFSVTADLCVQAYTLQMLLKMKFSQINPQKGLVAWVAFAWGLMAFMPVGVNYLAFFVLAGAVLWQRDVGVRWQRLRNGLLAPALLLFAAWMLLVLALQDTWYSKTPSHLWHAFRIWLTIGLAASLSSDEAGAAVKGFLLGTAGVVLLILGYRVGLYGVHPSWEHLTMAGTNKTIGASILLTMAFGLLLARSVYSAGKERLLFAVAATVVLALIVQTLSKRTAMLGALIAVAAVLLHVWREHKGRWLLSLLIAFVFGFVVWKSSPGLQAQFAQGAHEIHDGLKGTVRVESWNVRIQMIKHTWDMMLERPWMGWGIGAWNHQWELRVPHELTGFNMPHNDLLWLGAESGTLGGIAWLLLMLSGLTVCWKSKGWAGAAAFAALLIGTFSSLVNNGTRDATIGLPMLWLMGVLVSLARGDLGVIRPMRRPR